MAKTPEIDVREDYQDNMIINGGMDFWQRGTTFNSIGAVYCADRWRNSSAAATYNVTQQPDSPNDDTIYSLRYEVASNAAIGAAQNSRLIYNMEGSDYRRIKSKKVVLSFRVKSSVVGTYSIAFKTFSPSNRSYIAEYSIDSANVWEDKKIVVDLDGSNGDELENGLGMSISWVLASGATLNTSTIGAWQSANFIGSTNQVDFGNTASATFNLTQVQVTAGSEVLPFRRAGRYASTERKLCERYCQLVEMNGQFSSAGNNSVPINYKSEMRTVPTLIASAGSFSSGSTLIEALGPRGFRLTCAGGGAGAVLSSGSALLDAEL